MTPQTWVTTRSSPYHQEGCAGLYRHSHPDGRNSFCPELSAAYQHTTEHWTLRRLFSIDSLPSLSPLTLLFTVLHYYIPLWKVLHCTDYIVLLYDYWYFTTTAQGPTLMLLATILPHCKIRTVLQLFAVVLHCNVALICHVCNAATDSSVYKHSNNDHKVELNIKRLIRVVVYMCFS